MRLLIALVLCLISPGLGAPGKLLNERLPVHGQLLNLFNLEFQATLSYLQEALAHMSLEGEDLLGSERYTSIVSKLTDLQTDAEELRDWLGRLARHPIESLLQPKGDMISHAEVMENGARQLMNGFHSLMNSWPTGIAKIAPAREWASKKYQKWLQLSSIASAHVVDTRQTQANQLASSSRRKKSGSRKVVSEKPVEVPLVSEPVDLDALVALFESDKKKQAKAKTGKASKQTPKIATTTSEPEALRQEAPAVDSVAVATIDPDTFDPSEWQEVGEKKKSSKKSEKSKEVTQKAGKPALRTTTTAQPTAAEASFTAQAEASLTTEGATSTTEESATTTEEVTVETTTIPNDAQEVSVVTEQVQSKQKKRHYRRREARQQQGMNEQMQIEIPSPLFYGQQQLFASPVMGTPGIEYMMHDVLFRAYGTGASIADMISICQYAREFAQDEETLRRIDVMLRRLNHAASAMVSVASAGQEFVNFVSQFPDVLVDEWGTPLGPNSENH